MTIDYDEQLQELLSNPEWSGFSDEDRNIVARGEAALIVITKRRTFDEWVGIGQASHALQRLAMQRSNSTNANGRRYADAYKILAPAHLRQMNKSERRQAILLFERAEMIRPWYAGEVLNDAGEPVVSDGDRRRMQHPLTILAKYEAWVKKNAPPPTGDGNPPDLEPQDDEKGKGKPRGLPTAVRVNGLDEAIGAALEASGVIRDDAHALAGQLREIVGPNLDLTSAERAADTARAVWTAYNSPEHHLVVFVDTLIALRFVAAGVEEATSPKRATKRGGGRGRKEPPPPVVETPPPEQAPTRAQRGRKRQTQPKAERDWDAPVDEPSEVS